MLNDLKKMINAEAESDLQVDLMLEAVNDSIADMFIEDDGEIEMNESEIIDVLEKIPAYDEEKELNKKLDRIVESYIPEELDGKKVEELENKMRDLENQIEDLKHYVNSKDGTPTHSLKLKKAEIELSLVEKKYKKLIKSMK